MPAAPLEILRGNLREIYFRVTDSLRTKLQIRGLKVLLCCPQALIRWLRSNMFSYHALNSVSLVWEACVFQ